MNKVGLICFSLLASVLPVIGSAEAFLFNDEGNRVTYTLEENRKIALIFQERDMYKDLHEISIELNHYKDSVINELQHANRIKDQAIDIAMTLASDINDAYIGCQEDLNISKAEAKRFRRARNISVITNIGLIILMIVL